MTKILCYFITDVGTVSFFGSNGYHAQIYIRSYRETLQEIIHVSFIKLLCRTQNKIQKLESELLKPYLKT